MDNTSALLCQTAEKKFRFTKRNEAEEMKGIRRQIDVDQIERTLSVISGGLLGTFRDGYHHL